MNAQNSPTIKKSYERPCVKVSTIELGVFGQYSEPDDGVKPIVPFDLGNTRF
jgi:hypothetical protein